MGHISSPFQAAVRDIIQLSFIRARRNTLESLSLSSIPSTFSDGNHRSVEVVDVAEARGFLALDSFVLFSMRITVNKGAETKDACRECKGRESRRSEKTGTLHVTLPPK
jgi:hypothetical protein